MQDTTYRNLSLALFLLRTSRLLTRTDPAPSAHTRCLCGPEPPCPQVPSRPQQQQQRPRDTYLQPTESLSRIAGQVAGRSGAPAPAAEAAAGGAEGVDEAATEAPSSRSALDIRSRAVERPGRLTGAFGRSPAPLGSATRTRCDGRGAPVAPRERGRRRAPAVPPRCARGLRCLGRGGETRLHKQSLSAAGTRNREVVNRNVKKERNVKRRGGRYVWRPRGGVRGGQNRGG